jgi:hypothetical protein
MGGFLKSRRNGMLLCTVALVKSPIIVKSLLLTAQVTQNTALDVITASNVNQHWSRSAGVKNGLSRTAS